MILMRLVVWTRGHKQSHSCPFFRKTLTWQFGQFHPRIWICNMNAVLVLPSHHIVVEQFSFLKHMGNKRKSQIWQIKKRHIRLNGSCLKANLLCHLDQAQSRRPIHGRLGQFSQVSQRIITTIVAKNHG